MVALTNVPDRSAAVVLLLKELKTKLRIDPGGVLHVIETENGIGLTPYDPVFDSQIVVADDIMGEERHILRKLAE